MGGPSIFGAERLLLGQLRNAANDVQGRNNPQQLALRHPDKVKSMILMCTWARQDRFGLYTWQHLMKCKAAMRPEDFMHYVQMLIFTKPWFDNDDCWNNMRQGLKDAAINPAPQPVHAMEAHKVNALVVIDGKRRVVGALNFIDLLRARVV